MNFRQLFLAVIFCISAAFTLRNWPYSISIVDGEGLTLSNGVYGNIINGQSFQQDALVSYKGYQYVTYYNAARQVCIARRRLPDGVWQVIRFADYHFSYARNQQNDAHNTISMGLCTKDGTIHLAFDHHASPLHYKVSVKNVLDGKLGWDSTLFSAVRDYLEEGKPVNGLTYPAFVTMPDGGLLLGYRKGGSNNASYYIGRYDGNAWGAFHEVISGQGDYQDPFKGVSKSRNAYVNGLHVDTRGRLHTSWVWREHNEGLGNRDLCYAYSDDGGANWNNTHGKPLGVINTFSEGITIKELDRGWGTMNSQAQVVDARGVPHVVMYHRQQHETPEWARFAKDARYFHYTRKADGSWLQTVIPAIGNRPKLLADARNDLYLVYIKKDHFDSNREAAPLAVARATAAKKYLDWKEVFETKEQFFNEPQVDAERFAREHVLSVLVQDAPASMGGASAVKVMDINVK